MQTKLLIQIYLGISIVEVKIRSIHSILELSTDRRLMYQQFVIQLLINANVFQLFLNSKQFLLLLI